MSRYEINYPQGNSMTTDSTTGPASVTHEVTFPLAWLAAIRLFAPKKYPREHLLGVAITRGGLVATNGKYLGVIRDARFDGLPEIILPNAAIDVFLYATKGSLGKGDVTVKWQSRCAPMLFTLAAGDVEHSYASQKGDYPDYTRVLIQRPRRPNVAIQFNWATLALHEKAAKRLRVDGFKPGIVLFQPCAGRSAARVTINGIPDFEGVVMSLRVDDRDGIPYEDDPELQTVAGDAKGQHN